MRYSDEFIAKAFEMHYGCGLGWEYIALRLNMPQKRLKNVVDFAKRHGMKKYRKEPSA